MILLIDTIIFEVGVLANIIIIVYVEKINDVDIANGKIL